MWTSSSRRFDPTTLLHPVVVAALLLLLVNDHLLKGSGLLPGWVTGKLSDVACLILLPVALKATIDLILERMQARGPSPRSIMWFSIAVTLAIYTAIQVAPPAVAFYERFLGIAHWVPRAIAAVIDGGEMPAVIDAQKFPDLTDLLLIPVCLVAVWIVSSSERVADA